MSDNGNPLLDRGFPVPFDRIGPGDVGPALAETLARADERIVELGAGRGGSYEDVVGALDAVTEEVERTWSPVSHLNNVDATPALREAYAAALPEITRFSSRLYQYEGLFRRLRDFAASSSGASLTGLRRRHLDRTLRDFRRAGAELGPADKETLQKLRVELSELSRRFEENLLEETAAYGKVVGDAEALAGLPETALERAAQLAAERGGEGGSSPWTCRAYRRCCSTPTTAPCGARSTRPNLTAARRGSATTAPSSPASWSCGAGSPPFSATPTSPTTASRP